MWLVLGDTPAAGPNDRRCETCRSEKRAEVGRRGCFLEHDRAHLCRVDAQRIVLTGEADCACSCVERCLRAQARCSGLQFGTADHEAVGRAGICARLPTMSAWP